MHTLKFIRRRYPNHYREIVGTLFLLSASALALGVGILLLF
jgi:hypothetical protein